MNKIRLSLLVLLTIGFLGVTKPSLSYAAITTYYFSPTFEKVKETGEITKYYPLPGGATAIKKDSELSYLYTDQLFSTRLITDSSGRKTSELSYYPYGSTFNQSSLNSPTDKLYTSQIKDASTNLYFYNARQYNPNTGAFISADSAQGPNRYAYVGGNPINLNDPSGNYETPYSGLEPDYWESLYQNYKVVFRNEKNAKFTPGEINKIMPILRKLPRELYKELTIVNSGNIQNYPTEDSLLLKINAFIGNLFGGSWSAADPSSKTIFLKDVCFWPIIPELTSLQPSAYVFIHELSHANEGLLGEVTSENEYYESFPKSYEGLDEWFSANPYYKLMNEYLRAGKWHFNEQKNKWESPYADWVTTNTIAPNPEEYFAIQSGEYFVNPGLYKELWGEELIRFFEKFYQGKF